MALIRMTRVDSTPTEVVVDGIVEAAADLDGLTGDPLYSGGAQQIASGSMMYCMEDGAVYIKGSNGMWEAAK